MSNATATKPEQAWHRHLACPTCKSVLICTEPAFRCTNPVCTASFPLVNGVPILINEAHSVFKVGDFTARKVTTFVEATPGGPPKQLSMLRRLVPSNSRAVHRGNDQEFIASFQDKNQWVLVIGAGDRVYSGQGKANLLYSDVHLGAAADLIADGHDLPFQDQTLDGVVAVSVLEHVVDPARCATEIVRVLKPGGRVFAATPFMQQVHLGRYDFTRFTHLGHRRLWHHFREIESGISCGPGMALAWAWQYFLLSFSEHKTVRKYLRAFAKFTSFPLPYLDEYLKDKAGAYDAASSFYFIGEKCEQPISDQEILRSYRGLDTLS